MRPPIALALLLATAPGAARAERAVLLPATGVNVSAETLAGARDLFFGHLLATRRWAVKALPGSAPEGGWTAPTAAEKARGAGADVAIALHLTRLEETTKVRVASYRTADGLMAWFDEAAATQPGEIDGALRRLAQGLAAGRPAAELAPRSAAAPPAYQQAPPPPPAYPPPPPRAAPAPAYPPPQAYAPPRAYPPPPAYGQPPAPPSEAGGRKRAEQVFGFAFVGAWATGPMALRLGESSAQGLEAFWLYDTRAVIATMRLSYLGGSNHQTAFGIGVNVPLLPGDVAPYATGGLAFTWSKWWDALHWSEGFTPWLGAGVLLGREWNVQVRAELAWFYDLYLSTNAAGSFHGQGFKASLGIGF